MIPVLRCARLALGDLSADASALPWRGLPGVRFCDAVTAAAPKQGTEVRAAWSE